LIRLIGTPVGGGGGGGEGGRGLNGKERKEKEKKKKKKRKRKRREHIARYLLRRHRLAALVSARRFRVSRDS